MLIKLLNENKNFLYVIHVYKDLCIIDNLDTGFKTLQFKVPLNQPYSLFIKEEQYILIEQGNFVIKEINKADNNYYTIYCLENLEELAGEGIDSFDAVNLTAEESVKLALAESNWSYAIPVALNTGTATIQQQYLSRKDALDAIKNAFNLEIKYETTTKTVYLYKTKGSNKGAYFFNDLNLKELAIQSNTYDFATKIIPIGKGGISIAAANDGSMSISNFNYSNKNIMKYWINDDYDTPETLKEAAMAHLEKICKPKASYRLKASYLPQDIETGDSILLIDEIKKIKDYQRVIKIYSYPDTPEKNKIDISNAVISFDVLQIQNQKQRDNEVNKLKTRIELLETIAQE